MIVAYNCFEPAPILGGGLKWERYRKKNERGYGKDENQERGDMVCS